MVGFQHTVALVAHFLECFEENVEINGPVTRYEMLVTVAMIILDMERQRGDAARCDHIGSEAAAPGVPNIEAPGGTP